MRQEIEQKRVCLGEDLNKRTNYFVPLSFFDFGELVVIEVVVRVHIDDLTFGGSSEHFDDLNEMVDAVFTYEKRCSLDHFQQNASY